MKPYIVLGALLAMATQAHAQSTTTVTRSQNGTSVITQSGDPATATMKVEKKGNATIITRKSGGNSSTVIQGGSDAKLPDDFMTPDMRRLFEMFGK